MLPRFILFNFPFSSPSVYHKLLSLYSHPYIIYYIYIYTHINIHTFIDIDTNIYFPSYCPVYMLFFSVSTRYS